MTTNRQPAFQGEAPTTDGHSAAKVPLNAIKFLDKQAVMAKIHGPLAERYARYCEHIWNGHYINGLPIVYRLPKGTLIASDLQWSDLAIYAEKNAPTHASLRRDLIDPKISVKIIDIDSPDEIVDARARYLGSRA